MIVSVGGPAGRTTRTDEAGQFLIARMDTGQYTLQLRRLGYLPRSVSVHVTEQGARVEVALDEITTLDTIRVRAARQAIYGVVGAAADLRPLPGSAIQILGESVRTLRADSSGRFFSPASPGTYLVRARAPGFAPRTVSVTLSPGDGAELALLLDSARAGSQNAMEAAYADFRDRMLRRGGTQSALVPRSELLRDGNGTMIHLLRAAPSFGSRVMRVGPYACVFVDGRARPGMSLNAIDPSGVEAIEVYTRRGERSGTLLARWPRGFPCADTGMPPPQTPEDVLWVVICLANQTGIDLTEAFKNNLDKKNARDKDRHRDNDKLR